jgi:predicted nucleotidyltransferase
MQISEWGGFKRVVLFGSYAKNTQHKWSDIDVALVADNFNGAGFYDIALFGKTLIKKPFRSIQPKTYNTKQFTSDKDPFVDEILRTGIEIEPRSYAHCFIGHKRWSKPCNLLQVFRKI